MLTVFLLVGSVFVRDTSSFECEANKFAASWNARPVEELIGWVGAGFLVGSHGVEALDGCNAPVD